MLHWHFFKNRVTLAFNEFINNLSCNPHTHFQNWCGRRQTIFIFVYVCFLLCRNICQFWGIIVGKGYYTCIPQLQKWVQNYMPPHSAWPFSYYQNIMSTNMICIKGIINKFTITQLKSGSVNAKFLIQQWLNISLKLVINH